MNRIRTRHPAALALLVGGAMAALVPVGAAVAEDSPPQGAGIQLQSSADLLARGAGVSVPVTYQCAAGDQEIEISVEVVQRSGSGTTYAYGSRTAPCTGGPQSTTVTVTAGDRVFKKGTAVATAEAFTCGFSFCGTISDSREITISR
ncbi:MAG TPA: hypothetical protein VK640_05370 [Actinomycetes bacterium]|nr:hypothetical protein [Actinomycetes bacterium]